MTAKSAVTTSMFATLATGIAAAVAAASLVAAPASGQAADGRQLSNYGYKGTAVGVKLYVNNVQALSTKDAVAPLRCTRMTGRNVHETSTVSAPDNPLIHLSSSTSDTVSYRDAGRLGVRATNVLGDITIGDATQEIPTPVVVLKGLSTMADAFHDADGYGHEETINYEEFSIVLPADQEVPPELQGLLDAIQEGVGQVITVLDQAPTPIEIPGLGTIALGRLKGVSNAHHAESDVAALEFVITASGENQKLQLGHTRARTGGPTPGGVFRSTSMPMDITTLDGNVHLGGVRPRTIPCEGTRGATRRRQLASASAVVPSGAVIGVTGVDYVFKGDQHRRGTADGFDANHIDEASMLGGLLLITDIDARATVETTSPSGKVAKKYSTSIGSITYMGEELKVPKPGGVTQLPNGEGYIERQIIDANKWGGRVTGVRVSLLEDNVVVDFGIAAAQIFAY